MSKMSSKFVFAALIALSAGGQSALAAASDQFDLVCTGQEQKATGVPPSAWKESFRIDLNQRLWCRGDCKAPAQISTITADQIVLQNSRATLGGPANAEAKLFRNDGRIVEYIHMGWSGATASLAEGTCTRDSFSGFPGKKF